MNPSAAAPLPLCRLVEVLIDKLPLRLLEIRKYQFLLLLVRTHEPKQQMPVPLPELVPGVHHVHRQRILILRLVLPVVDVDLHDYVIVLLQEVGSSEELLLRALLRNQLLL